jgi:hypothetical protein
LVALIRAPLRQLDAPSGQISLGRRQIGWKLAGVRAREPLLARSYELLLCGREAPMQRQKELREAGRQIAAEDESGRSDVQACTSAVPS